ncbi:MAG TPA: DUF2147 domain-containing protein [Hyphomicrobiaceae bacterium]|nr:DUF2147 domain-containing protein [Hyphomicrobiaceae bacterium]
MVKSMTAAAAGLVALSLASAPAAAQKAEDALGVWRNPENGSNVEFYKCGESVCGKIVKVVDGQKTDDKNPDAAKRNRPIVGLVIMQGAKKTGDNKWSGNLYNRENGSTYSGTVTVKSKNELDLSGCVAMVLCKTVTWTRVK